MSFDNVFKIPRSRCPSVLSMPSTFLSLGFSVAATAPIIKFPFKAGRDIGQTSFCLLFSKEQNPSEYTLQQASLLSQRPLPGCCTGFYKPNAGKDKWDVVDGLSSMLPKRTDQTPLVLASALRVG